MPIYKICIFLLISHVSLCQATVTRTTSANIIVNSYISFDVTTIGFLDFKFNTNQELLDGINLANKFRVNISSNKNWILNVSSLTSNFMAIGPEASSQMPPSILGIKKNSSDLFVPISNNPSSVALGFRGNQTNSGNSFNLDIKATPGFEYNGGAYMLVLIFTISPQ